MAAEKENTKANKAEEPAIEYEASSLKTDREKVLDFDAEFENGLTIEEFRAEMLKRIKAYPWEK